MQRLSARFSMLILALVCSAILCSCDDEDPSGIQPDPDCIGPAGGQVAETDTNDSLHGVSLTVQPGAWQECWSVYFGYNWTFSTPDFPDGLAGYAGMFTGSLELEIGRQETHTHWIDAPDSLDMELSFPLRDMTVEPGERLTAFRYDEAAGIYRLQFPDRADSVQMTVATHRCKPLWTWGKVDLMEVDFDTYLAPVMHELHGEGTWLEIAAQLDSLRLAAIEGEREATCYALSIVRGSLAAARDAAADNVRLVQDALQGECGVCDATTGEFYEGLRDYLRLKLEVVFLDLFFGNMNSFFLKLYGLIMVEYKLYLIRQLACDYECFAFEVDPAFYYHLANYYVCTLIVSLVDYAMTSGYIDCGLLSNAETGEMELLR